MNYIQILCALSATMITTRGLSYLWSRTRDDLPTITVEPLLLLTNFLRHNYDMVCLGDTEHRNPLFETITSDRHFIMGAARQGYSNVFKEISTLIRESFNAIKWGEHTQRDLNNLSRQLSMWLSQKRLEKLAHRHAENIRARYLRYYAIDTRVERFSKEVPAIARSMLKFFMFTSSAIQLFFPGACFSFFPSDFGFNLTMKAMPSFARFVLDDRSMGQLIRRSVTPRTAEDNRRLSSFVCCGSGHYTGRAQQSQCKGLITILEEQGFQPVVVNIYGSQKACQKMHWRKKKLLGDCYRPADVDYIAGRTAEETVICFNNGRLAAGFATYIRIRPQPEQPKIICPGFVGSQLAA